MNPVLVVDDDESYRELVMLALEDHCGVEVHGFGSAAPLLQHLGGGAAAALVLLDLHMADMNGVALLREVQRLQPRLPVAFLSGAAAAEEREACLAGGACAFLRKPVAYTELIRLLQELLRDRA